MRKIYYLDKAILFVAQANIDPKAYIVTHSADQAKVELFSDSAKPVALISNDSELEFLRFISTFDMIEAGGGVVRNPEGQTLMIFRNERWDLPKGKLEPSERIEDCAMREVEEECNITGLVLGDFRGHTYHIYELHGRHILKKSWWWNMSHSGSGELTPQVAEGITDARWVGEEEMAENLRNSYSTIRDLLTM